jgi:hypothetical protein
MAYGFEKLQQFGFKTETVEGTAETMVAGDYDSVVLSAAIEYDRAVATRNPVRSSFSPIQPIGGATFGTVKATLEARGSGTDATPPDWYQLLRAAGASVTTDVATFGAEIAAAQEIGTNVTCRGRDGIFERILAGVRGSVKLYGEGVGMPIKVDFDGKGGYTQTAQNSLLASVAPVVGVPPILMGSALTIGGAAVQYKDLEISIENEILPLPSGASTNGFAGYYITGQKFAFKANIWQTNATADFFARLANSATSDKQAVSWTFGSGTGLTFTCTGNIGLNANMNKTYDSGMALIPVIGEFYTEGATAALTISQA